MDNREALLLVLRDMDKVARALEVDPFEIYFLGGSACLMGGYTSRATRDFDFVDQRYPAAVGRVLRYLGDFDMLEYESTLLAPTYRERAIRLDEFTYLSSYVLSREDIVVSKIIRMEERDLEDMDELMKQCDKALVLQLIDEVQARSDLYPSKKEGFLQKVPQFLERYNV